MEQSNAELAKSAERARVQRERILNAAQKCFVEHGFHAASMGDIAKTAGMSQGLIYRYYESKSAIILAIIERQLEEGRAEIRSMHATDDLAVALFDTYRRWRDKDPSLMNVALFADISAAATRSPELLAAMEASDKPLRDELSTWLVANVAERTGATLAPETAQLRALSLQIFIEGLIMRALREPNIDEGHMWVVIADFVEKLMAPGA